MRSKIYSIILLITTIPYLAPAEEPVYFADVNLKAVVEETLGITDPNQSDMLALFGLWAMNRGIDDLTGIEYAKNLRYLYLDKNQVSDISPLADLTDLKDLQIQRNEVSDISDLAGLINLTDLHLYENQINDISALEGLINLTFLFLNRNQINDISVLANLTKLTGLLLDYNHIGNISALVGLTNLTSLHLGYNRISEISALSDLTSLRYLTLGGNQINNISALAGLTNLEVLNVYGNGISEISALAGLTNLDYLNLHNNRINDTSWLSGMTKLTSLQLGYNPIGDISVLAELTDLTNLGMAHIQISDISKLEGLINLQALYLSDNQIHDISALTGLTNLIRLKLDNNRIIDISALTELSNLVHLDLRTNPLNQDECYIYVEQIRENNPGIELLYDGCIPSVHFYVDDDALYDPGVGNPEISDKNENGSQEHPFDTIQEAIDAAENGYTVLVYPGIYTEEINFLGKAITVQGVATSAGIPVLENPDGIAAAFFNAEQPNSVLKNFVIGNSAMAVYILGSSPTISNITVVDNIHGIGAFGQAEPNITNSIFWNNLKEDLFQCQAHYSCIERGGGGEGNINVDPLFVDPNTGDYHLRSKRGRYWQEHDVWILDNSTSPCIDAGDPLFDLSTEPFPNGGRINMGAYGGTAFASMSE